MKQRRGGPRNTGMKLPHNTSGLPGIGFKRQGLTVYVTAAVRSKRPARSTSAHGAREALRQRINLRKAAGLPAPTLGAAVSAFAVWYRKN